MELVQLKKKERETLREQMRKEHGAGVKLAKEIGICRQYLYHAVNGEPMGYAALDKIRKHFNKGN